MSRTNPKQTRKKTPMNNQPLQRDFSTASIRAVSDDENSRTFELSFSSEEPVQMWFGTEILDHSGNAIDMSRMQSMGIVLFNHDRNRVIGKVTRAWVEDNRGKATIEFDNDEDSETVRSKVASGTLKGVSVGYRVSNYESVKEGAKSLDGRFTGPCYIAKKWQPYEISIVSVPADTTVGVGRDMTEDGQPPTVQTAPGLAFYESQLAANRNY